jgi:hypothetical protein
LLTYFLYLRYENKMVSRSIKWIFLLLWFLLIGRSMLIRSFEKTMVLI